MDICRICLAIDIKVYKLSNNEAKSFIENIFIENGFNQVSQQVTISIITIFLCEKTDSTTGAQSEHYCTLRDKLYLVKNLKKKHCDLDIALSCWSNHNNNTFLIALHCFIKCNCLNIKIFFQELQETQYICYVCKALLDKSYKFIKRVLKAQELLYDMLKEKKAVSRVHHKLPIVMDLSPILIPNTKFYSNLQITPERLKKIDRSVTGFKLVKDFKNIDLSIREEENNNTKNNILRNDQCEVEINDTLTEDVLENSDNDKKAFDLDILKEDIYLDTSSELDVKDFIGKISKEEKLDVSFDDFEVINCELEETKLADEIKVEICVDNDNNTVKKKKKRAENEALKNSIVANKILASTRSLNKKPKKENLNKKRYHTRSTPLNEENAELFEYNGTEDYTGPRQLMGPEYPVKCEHVGIIREFS